MAETVIRITDTSGAKVVEPSNPDPAKITQVEEPPKAATPEVTPPKETSPASKPSSGDAPSGAQPAGNQPPKLEGNDANRYQYWQSEATKLANRVQELEKAQLSTASPEERERFQANAERTQLKDELIKTQLATGYWETQFPELKYLDRSRLESIVRTAYDANPDNPIAVTQVIETAAQTTRVIAEKARQEVQVVPPPVDQPAQAAVTPNPSPLNMSETELKKTLGKMSREDLKKLWGSMQQE